MAALSIIESTKEYEEWLRAQLDNEIVEPDLARKHEKMAESAFPFLRATYWRWAETILDICPELANAPSVLAVGDIHLENFGTWRDEDGRLVWGVNDFDEAAEMPYVLDLLRLATSAELGCPHLESTEAICGNIITGYQRGLDDPHAIVLDLDYAWLRKLVVVPEQDRLHFWQKVEALKPAKKPPPTRYVRMLADAMPDRKLKMKFHPRTAGAGSLGRPRWVGVAQWHGAPIMREAKAAVPSAWTRIKGRGSRALRCYEIATGTYRAPDPWYALEDDIVVRRLSPNNRKLDAEGHPLELISRKMLRLMGRELAAVHLGLVDARAAIKRDLAKRHENWLSAAVTRAAKFVRREQKEWRRATNGVLVIATAPPNRASPRKR